MECRVEFDYVAQEPDELTIKKGDIIKNVQSKMDGWYEGTLRGKTGVFPDNFVKLVEKPAPEQKAPSQEQVVVMRNNPSSARKVRVLFSYSPEQDDELSLDVGDVLDFIEEVEEGWWRGKLKGREGIFPSNFVEEVEEPKTNGGFVETGHAHPVATKQGEEPPKQKETIRNSLSKVGIPVPDVVPATRPTDLSIGDDEPAPELPPKPVRELARCFYPYAALNEDELSLSEGDIVTIISRQCEDEGWWRGELRGKIGLFPDNFVKIITPGEAQSGGGQVIGPHGKMLAQERNVNVTEFKAQNNSKRDSVDGMGVSKIEQTKQKLNKSNSKEGTPPPVAPAITPKVGVATSPISPGIAAFHSNLFSNQQKPPDAFGKSGGGKEKEVGGSGGARGEEEQMSEEFNSVERTETLNHLTATRAKAPKRRPPSTIITRENEIPMLNGSSNSYDSSQLDSPPHHHHQFSSTPMNGTMSGSFTEGSSSLNHSGSFLSHNTTGNSSSRGGDKDGSSPTPASSANTSATGKPKPQKQTLPWMAELKQTQDKKRSLVSPVAPPPSVTPSPTPSAVASQTPPKEVAVRAPPLPAKPSSLSSAAAAPPPPATEKPQFTNNLNHSSSVAPVPTPTPAPAPSKPSYPPTTTKKSQSPAPTITNHNHHASSFVDNARGDADNNTISNKAYVSWEEHLALKTRVTSLENEVEHLKRQLKMLLDRDLRGHIV